jgi:hypothetical protein
MGQAFPTAETFIAHFKAVSRAIRAVDPQAQIGVDIHRDDVKWGNYLLKQLAGDYDFVAPHYYCGANLREAAVRRDRAHRELPDAGPGLRTQALLRAYNPGRDVYQYDTEWGMICNAPGGKDADYEGRNANIIGTLHRAVRLIYYAREDILRGASGWQMLSKLNAPASASSRRRRPTNASCSTGFTTTSTATWANGRWPPMVSRPYYQPKQEADRAQFSGPLTPVLATLSKDERELYLVIANGSWTRSVPCRVHLRNFAAARATGVLLTQDQLDGSPLLDRKEDAVKDFPVVHTGDDVTCLLPPHAVVFVTLERAK